VGYIQINVVQQTYLTKFVNRQGSFALEKLLEQIDCEKVYFLAVRVLSERWKHGIIQMARDFVLAHPDDEARYIVAFNNGDRLKKVSHYNLLLPEFRCNVSFRSPPPQQLLRYTVVKIRERLSAHELLMMNRSDFEAREEYVCINQADVDKETRLMRIDLLESYLEAAKHVFDEWKSKSLELLVEQMSNAPRMVCIPPADRILCNAGPPPEVRETVHTQVFVFRLQLSSTFQFLFST
jgi:hypothetical protein